MLLIKLIDFKFRLFIVSTVLALNCCADNCDRNFQLNENDTSSNVTSSMLGLESKRSSSYQCQWSFISQSNYVLKVQMKPDQTSTLDDRLYVYDNKKYTGWVSLAHSMKQHLTFLSFGGELRFRYVHYNSSVTPQFELIYSQYKLRWCSLPDVTSLPQTLSVESGNASDCLWIIHGSLINLTINSLQLERGDYLEVYKGPLLLSRIHHTLDSSVSLLARSSLGMNILYHKTSLHGNFSAAYQKASCGPTYQLVDTTTQTTTLQLPSLLFDQPNYSYLKIYPIKCDFYFEAQPGHVIDIDIRHNQSIGYSNDIKVYDNLTFLGSFTNNHDGVRSFISTRPKIHLEMSLRFSFDRATSNHFYPNMKFIFPIKFKQVHRDCGNTLVAKSTGLMLPPPGHALVDADADCVWMLITNSWKRYIQLTIEQLDISAQDGFLQVNSKLTNLGKFRNESTPIILLSDVNQYYPVKSDLFQRMTVYFHSGSSNASKRFRASYKEVECGKTIDASRTNSDQSLILPPNMNKSPSNLTCDYTFLSPNDDWMRVVVTDRYPTYCCGNLKVVKGSEVIDETNQQRTTISILITGSLFRLHYVTGFGVYLNSRFHVKYRCFANTCGYQLRATAAEQTISSSGQLDQGGTYKDCVWVITAHPLNQILLTLNSIQLGSGDYLEVSEEMKITETYTASINSPIIFPSRKNQITLHLHYRTSKGINVSFKEVNVPCGDDLVANKTSAFLSPPGHYNLLSIDQDCFWVITTSSSDSYVQLIIEQLDIKDKESYLQVTGKSREFGKFRNESTPIFLQSDGQRLTVYFHTGSNNASSTFRASYKEVVCGKTIFTSRTSNDQSLYLPQFLNNVPTHVTCDYTFLSSEFDWMKIVVTDDYPFICCNIVQAFQGNRLLASMNQKTPSASFLITEKHFRLHYVTNSSNYRNDRYLVKYRRFANNCGSQLHANTTEQIITSPGYPSYYSSNRDCVWVITANPSSQIRLTLSDLQLSHGTYLEVREGTTKTEKYTGTISSPITFVSNRSRIVVYFHSNYYRSNKGFKASFEADFTKLVTPSFKSNTATDGSTKPFSIIDSTIQPSPTIDVTIQPSSTFEGTIQPSPTIDGTIQPSNTIDGTTPLSYTSFGVTRPSPTADGTTKSFHSTDGITQPFPTTSGTSQPSLTTNGITQLSSVTVESHQLSSRTEDPTKPTPTNKETTQVSPTNDKTTKQPPISENITQSTLDFVAHTTQSANNDVGLLLPVWAILSIALGGAALLIGPGVLI